MRDSGRELVQEVLLERAHDQRDIGLADQHEFLVTLGDRRRAPGTAGVQLGESLLAQEMEVHGIEHDRARAVRTNAAYRCA